MKFCLLIDKLITEEQNISLGGYSIVNEGHLINMPVAIKKANQISTTPQEINMLQQVKSPYLPIFFGLKRSIISSVNTFTPEVKEKSLSIILERIKGKTLDHYLASQPSRLLKYININELSSIMLWLHSFNFIHKDIKPKNIMVNENMTIKLLDFGVSVKVDDCNGTSTSDAGTLCYMSPEYVPEFDKQGKLIPKIHERSDVWAFGLVVSEMFSNTKPWASLIKVNSIEVPRFLNDKIPFPIPENIDELLERKLIDVCTKYDLLSRISSKEALVFSQILIYKELKKLISNNVNNNINNNKCYSKSNNNNDHDHDNNDNNMYTHNNISRKANYDDVENNNNNKVFQISGFKKKYINELYNIICGNLYSNCFNNPEIIISNNKKLPPLNLEKECCNNETSFSTNNQISSDCSFKSKNSICFRSNYKEINKHKKQQASFFKGQSKSEYYKNIKTTKNDDNNDLKAKFIRNTYNHMESKSKKQFRFNNNNNLIKNEEKNKIFNKSDKTVEDEFIAGKEYCNADNSSILFNDKNNENSSNEQQHYKGKNENEAEATGKPYSKDNKLKFLCLRKIEDALKHLFYFLYKNSQQKEKESIRKATSNSTFNTNKKISNNNNSIREKNTSEEVNELKNMETSSNNNNNNKCNAENENSNIHTEKAKTICSTDIPMLDAESTSLSKLKLIKENSNTTNPLSAEDQTIYYSPRNYFNDKNNENEDVKPLIINNQVDPMSKIDTEINTTNLNHIEFLSISNNNSSKNTEAVNGNNHDDEENLYNGLRFNNNSNNINNKRKDSGLSIKKNHNDSCIDYCYYNNNKNKNNSCLFSMNAKLRKMFFELNESNVCCSKINNNNSVCKCEYFTVNLNTVKESSNNISSNASSNTKESPFEIMKKSSSNDDETTCFTSISIPSSSSKSMKINWTEVTEIKIAKIDLTCEKPTMFDFLGAQNKEKDLTTIKQHNHNNNQQQHHQHHKENQRLLQTKNKCPYFDGQELFILLLNHSSFAIVNSDLELIQEFSPKSSLTPTPSNNYEKELLIQSFDIYEPNKIIYSINNNLIVFDLLTESESIIPIKNYKSITRLLCLGRFSSAIVNNININNAPDNNTPNISNNSKKISKFNNNFTNNNNNNNNNNNFNNNNQKQNDTFSRLLKSHANFSNNSNLNANSNNSLYYNFNPTESVLLACVSNNSSKTDFIIYSIPEKRKLYNLSDYSESWDQRVFKVIGSKLLFTESNSIINIVDFNNLKSEGTVEIKCYETILDVNIEDIQVKDSFSQNDDYLSSKDYNSNSNYFPLNKEVTKENQNNIFQSPINFTNKEEAKQKGRLTYLFVFCVGNLLKTFELNSKGESRLISNTSMTVVTDVVFNHQQQIINLGNNYNNSIIRNNNNNCFSGESQTANSNAIINNKNNSTDKINKISKGEKGEAKISYNTSNKKCKKKKGSNEKDNCNDLEISPVEKNNKTDFFPSLPANPWKILANSHSKESQNCFYYNNNLFKGVYFIPHNNDFRKVFFYGGNSSLLCLECNLILRQIEYTGSYLKNSLRHFNSNDNFNQTIGAKAGEKFNLNKKHCFFISNSKRIIVISNELNQGLFATIFN